MPRSDEELSEIEEFVDLMCREHDYLMHGCWCPLYIVAGCPSTYGGGACLGFTFPESLAFASGFDSAGRGHIGPHGAAYPELREMGIRFSQRFAAGEYDHAS